MAAATARSTGEVAALRAAAEIARHQSPYRATVADAVCVTLDWLTGETEVAPVTGAAVEPTPEAVAREMLRATDAETEARRSGGESAWPGKVGHTLSWWRAEPFVEPPLY
jgi:hypothetical protein